jgi:RNA polymerase sigma-70 factor (ECF subfamily)
MDHSLREAARQWTLAVPAVSAFISSLVRDFQDRDDILQETAVAVLHGYNRYDPARPFLAWAMGIARLQTLSHLRKKGADKLVFDSAAVDAIATAIAQDSAMDARLERLRDCARKLDPDATELCRLRYTLDLKPAAIAERLGQSANTVAKALQRVRDRLRDCIEHKASALEANP